MVQQDHVSRRRHPRWRLAAAAAVVPFVLVACGGGDDAGPVAAPAVTVAESGDQTIGFGLVSAEQAAALAVDDSITVIDVRTPEEFAEGHLAGATMIDFYSDTFADQMAALDPDGTYLLYCRSGNRSGQATALLSQLGFEQVYDIDGGVLAWDAAGLPLVR